MTLLEGILLAAVVGVAALTGWFFWGKDQEHGPCVGCGQCRGTGVCVLTGKYVGTGKKERKP